MTQVGGWCAAIGVFVPHGFRSEMVAEIPRLRWEVMTRRCRGCRGQFEKLMTPPARSNDAKNSRGLG